MPPAESTADTTSATPAATNGAPPPSAPPDAAKPTAPPAAQIDPATKSQAEIDEAWSKFRRQQQGLRSEREAFAKQQAELREQLAELERFKSNPLEVLVAHAQKSGKPLAKVVEEFNASMAQYDTPDAKIAKLEQQLEADRKAREERERAEAERAEATFRAQKAQEFHAFVRAAADAYPDLAEYENTDEIGREFLREAQAYYQENGTPAPWGELAEKLDKRLAARFDALEAVIAKRKSRGASKAEGAKDAPPAQTGRTQAATPEGDNSPKTLTNRIASERSSPAPAESRDAKLKRLARTLRFR